MKVLKFGGSSIRTPKMIRKVKTLVSDKETKLIVLSAIEGTTNSLYSLLSYIETNDINSFELEEQKLKSKYEQFILDLFHEKQYYDKASFLIGESFKTIHLLLSVAVTSEKRFLIIAQGEYLSTSIFHLFLEMNGIHSKLLDALDFMRIDKEGEPDMFYIEENLKIAVENEQNGITYITQGFICRDYFGKVKNLGRGGSDYSATLMGAALNASEIQIWTDIDGIHNNDPRLVSSTLPVDELSYHEAAELAYFGARILHPESVYPAQLRNIPILLKNTFSPEKKGTLVSSSSRRDKIKSIAAKDGITAIRIKSARMLMAYGFLRKVFQVFEDYKTAIDMISTSEVSVSLTIDDTTNLDLILKSLQGFGEVNYDSDQTIICVVGDFLIEKTGMASLITNSLKDIPIRMISYGGSKNNISLLVKTSDKRKALNALHERIYLN